MLQLARYLKHFKSEITVGPFFKLLEAVIDLIVPLVMASIIDKGIRNGDKAYVLQRGAVMLVLGIMGLIFALICQYSAARASQGFGTIVRNDLYKHINSLSHAELDQLGTNFLTTVIINDVNQMQLAVAMLIRLAVRAPFIIIGAIVMAMFIDVKLSVIFLVVAPLVALTMYIVMKKSVPFYRIRQKALDKVSLITRENLTGARVIRAFSKQEKEEKRFDTSNEEVARIAIRVGSISAFLNPINFVILNTAIIAIIWFGGMRVNVGSLSQGEVIAFTNYITQISLTLIVVANLVVIFTKAAASAARINKVFATKSVLNQINGSIKTGSGSFAVNETDGESQSRPQVDRTMQNSIPRISLTQVSFAYPDSEEYSLENINVSIMEGETVGIIGGTGSGKSTFINLLPRFYDVTKGEIRYDGIPVKNIPAEELRRQFGIVPQKAVLFTGSVMENIRWAKEDASKEEIMKAVEIAQAKDFVEKLPQQYDTMIVQDGKNLSGGQRQRLTIARALVRKPKVLILDDSFSALDFATDAKLRQSLAENCSGMTMILVSQRANTLKHADKIIVLDDGRIVGIGKHEELIDTCEVYREICSSQGLINSKGIA